jgi:predicted TIM-barrel fold metal-dependent hydrolase
MEHLAAAGREIGTVSPTLAGYLDAIGAWLQRIKSLGTRGIKLDNAYRRELHFLDTPTADAERVYGRIWEESRGSRRSALGFDETRPLQDFLVHRLVEMAGGLDLAVAFHTGLQAGVENDLDLARPERLWNLAVRYKGTRFVLLHAGIPWTDEAAMMAKCFPNVWVDMAWTHLISPVLARRALFAWIDYVPRNKILGFGGDTRVVEGVYGYLSIAKQNMCDALARAVEEGRMGVADARGWIDSLLHDNPCEVYRLPGARI